MYDGLDRQKINKVQFVFNWKDYWLLPEQHKYINKAISLWIFHCSRPSCVNMRGWGSKEWKWRSFRFDFRQNAALVGRELSPLFMWLADRFFFPWYFAVCYLYPQALMSRRWSTLSLLRVPPCVQMSRDEDGEEEHSLSLSHTHTVTHISDVGEERRWGQIKQTQKDCF